MDTADPARAPRRNGSSSKARDQARRIEDESPVPDGWEPGERTYPYLDPRIDSMVVAHHGPDRNLMVSVSPMMFNDRVVLTQRSGYPRTWVAGFCYPKGPAASLAAMAWNPLVTDQPAGFERVAGDERDPSDLPSAATPTPNA